MKPRYYGENGLETFTLFYKDERFGELSILKLWVAADRLYYDMLWPDWYEEGCYEKLVKVVMGQVGDNMQTDAGMLAKIIRELAEVCVGER